MPVTFLLREILFELEGTITVKQALLQLRLSREAYLIVREGQLLNDNDVLRNGETVKIIHVISGG